MVDLDILSVLPSKPKLKKKNEILRVKVVETYKKKIVGRRRERQGNRTGILVYGQHAESKRMKLGPARPAEREIFFPPGWAEKRREAVPT